MWHVKFTMTCRSYTRFKYSSLQITPSVIKAGQNVYMEVSVENVGVWPSDEVLVNLSQCLPLFSYFSPCKVIQVYISWLNISNAPIRQLVGIDRQFIAPTEIIKVSVSA